MTKLGEALSLIYDLSRADQEILFEELSGILAPEDTPMLPSQIIDLRCRTEEYRSGEAQMLDGETVMHQLRQRYEQR
jgi:hypothetical protein